MPRPERRSPWRSNWFLADAALAVALAAGGLAFGLAGGGGDDEPERSSVADPQDDPGVSHVHGLGVNPGDELLYVATHYGTFRIPEEAPAQRVGGSYQDTMGFTIAGADKFLGSGHPDTKGFQQGQPARLGLIESTDRGTSWTSQSLLGEVDFHALSFAHGRVYGWDSTNRGFMVSADKKTWETRSQRDIFSFAVDPADPEHVVATGPEGLLDSPDGGRSWTTAPGPGVVVVSWDPAAGLYGAAADGAIHRSSDGSATWTPVGPLPGPPQALLATPDVLYAAAEVDDGTSIYRSVDEGRTWTLRYRDGA